ncbi:DUF1800 family protein [Parvularcula maris]|uniref:DUF1800 domain-containing protein n=1 Tax=Parvularcula maris TaxID=2965077 RepID=A0A9X2L8F0_9PROT|nr:DUF1800 family protein [Parvularcula maris]MCQ8185029.1 DUF1800 domain-containing protein [Parvularcula maris]
MSETEASRFLVQTTFGPRPEDVIELQQLGYTEWFKRQVSLDDNFNALGRYDSHIEAGGDNDVRYHQAMFTDNALRSDAQLRWRMVDALSQILVVSFEDNSSRLRKRHFADYLDLLHEESLGNYCDLVEGVTEHPLMALYLSFHQNRKADPALGSAPDENYARELLQLFTIGLDELHLDGTPTGSPTYNNDDIEGLARVFTGFSAYFTNFSDRPDDPDADIAMTVDNQYHEGGPKAFLGTVLDTGADATRSREAALSHILGHSNVAPFISKRLIQHFIRSNPTPSYVERVSRAFETGSYTLPDGTVVGEGRRCDLSATMGAVIFDPEARDAEIAAEDEYGKVRSTRLRQLQILRVFAKMGPVSQSGLLPEIGRLRFDWALSNHRFFEASSVFNDFRSTFVPSGTEMSAKGLVAPEMEILTAEHILSVDRNAPDRILENVRENGLDEYDAVRFVELARTPELLADRLDVLFTYGTLPEEDKQLLLDMIIAVGNGREPADLTDGQLENRIRVAVRFFASTPQYIVQR